MRLLDDIVSAVLGFLANLFIGLGMTPVTYIVVRILVVALAAYGVWRLFSHFFTIGVTVN